LLILPPLDDSLADKLIIFKIEHRAVPAEIDTQSLEGRKAFRQRLSAELPAYVYFLLNEWKIEPEFVSQRYGVTHFHHQDILVQLGELEPETRLLRLIDAEIFKLPITSDWKGSADELESRLLNPSSDVVHQARTLLSWQCACGTYLGRLKKIYPKRISYQRTHLNRIWTIVSPG